VRETNLDNILAHTARIDQPRGDARLPQRPASVDPRPSLICQP